MYNIYTRPEHNNVDKFVLRGFFEDGCVGWTEIEYCYFGDCLIDIMGVFPEDFNCWQLDKVYEW